MLTAGLVFALSVFGAMPAAQVQHEHHMGAPPSGCDDTSPRCASAATPAFASDGALMLAWGAQGRLWVARSKDLGVNWASPVAVNPEPVTLDAGADSRPQILVNPDARIVVAYAVIKDERYNGQVLTATSDDGGLSFSRPRPITGDMSSQRFVCMALDRVGRIFAAWIDKRNSVAAKNAGKSFTGASLAFSWSSDAGSTFGAAGIVQDNICECCRIGVAMAAPNRPVLIFRNIFGGERDHGVVTFDNGLTPGAVLRVSEDHWKIEACPHHGPSISVTADGTYHAVWFCGGGVRQGTFYARSRDEGRTFSAPLPIGVKERHPTRPDIYALARTVWATWKEFDGSKTAVMVMVSQDSGATWSAPHQMAETADYSDHPLLVSDGRRVYLSWLTRIEGYRLFPLEAQP